MRPIAYVLLDKNRPALILTPESVLPYTAEVTVAPITSAPTRLPTHLAVGHAEGLDHPSTIKCEGITTIRAGQLGRTIGHLPGAREWELRDAILVAFGLPPVQGF